MAEITGANSSETITGSSTGETIFGLSGNDVIEAGGGNDTIYGGTGSDTIDGGAGNDFLIGEGGAERYILSATDNGNDVIDAFEYYTDMLDASAISETITVTVIDPATMVLHWSGGSVTLINMVDVASDWSDRKLFGYTYSGSVEGDLPGDGVWDGTSGDDNPIMGDSDADGDVFSILGTVMDLGAGNDEVAYDGLGRNEFSGGSGNDRMAGGGGQDDLMGGDDDDNITGGNGKDLLEGGAGNDTLDGGNGIDTIDGGTGDDVLSGGRGPDCFVFRADDGNDTITDFKLQTDGFHLMGIEDDDIAFSNLGGGQYLLEWNDSNSVTVNVDGPNNENATLEEFLSVDCGDDDPDPEDPDPEDPETKTVMTEDVWFMGQACATDKNGEIDTVWTVHNGSDKIELSVEIPLESIVGASACYTFSDVDITDLLAAFSAVGVTSVDEIDINIQDDKISISLIERDHPLTQEQIDALPEDFDFPVQLKDEHGVERWLNVCVGMDEKKVYSPIAFDLNGDGEIGVTGNSTAEIRIDDTIGNTVLFDMDADGTLDVIEWLSGDGDALLVDNRDGQALYDMDGDRLFGDLGGFDHGYDKLALLDTNFDGTLTGEELNGLSLWVDNGDACVKASELFTVQELGFTAISVEAHYELNGNEEILVRAEATQLVDTAEPEVSGPNLYIDAMTANDATLADGQDLSITMTVGNNGNEDASATSYFYWSADDVFGNGDEILVAMDSHGTLTAGELDGSEGTTIDAAMLAGLGNGYIFAAIDPINSVAEANEDDNVSGPMAITFETSAGSDADLYFANTWLDDTSIEDGQNVKLWMHVGNKGETDAVGETTIYWSADDVFDASDIAIDSDGHGTLNAGEIDTNERERIDFDDLAEFGQSGYIFAVIDDAGLVSESNEGNNVSEGHYYEMV